MKDQLDAAEVASPIERLCVDKGLRMTSQRRVVAQVLSASHDHPDVQEVHRRVRRLNSRIALSTTYRTVRLFCKKGIVETHNFGVGRARLETNAGHHHDYLIDAHSGDVVEFRLDDIERLLTETASRLGYRLIKHKLELYAVPIDEAGRVTPNRSRRRTVRSAVCTENLNPDVVVMKSAKDWV